MTSLSILYFFFLWWRFHGGNLWFGTALRRPKRYSSAKQPTLDIAQCFRFANITTLVSAV